MVLPEGNGRIGRLWQSLILCNYNNLFEYLPIETLIYENQQQYYDALSKSEKEVLSTLVTYFSKNELVNTATAVTLLNKSKVNIRKYFGKFMKLNILIPIGENKGRKYKLNKDVLDNK